MIDAVTGETELVLEWGWHNEVRLPAAGRKVQLPDLYGQLIVLADPGDPDTIWRQDHSGVYRTTDGADSWQRIEQGLPANFGFPIVRDPGSGALFVVPLEADVNRTPVEGRFAAYRSTDGGESWQASGVGWPDKPTYDTVLRGAMAVDGDGGVYAGTTGGRLWATDDAGDSWHELPGTFPRIHAVAVL